MVHHSKIHSSGEGRSFVAHMDHVQTQKIEKDSVRDHARGGMSVLEMAPSPAPRIGSLCNADLVITRHLVPWCLRRVRPVLAVTARSSIVDTDFSIQDEEVETTAKALLTGKSRKTSWDPERCRLRVRGVLRAVECRVIYWQVLHHFVGPNRWPARGDSLLRSDRKCSPDLPQGFGPVKIVHPTAEETFGHLVIL